MPSLTELLEASSALHRHLCPRQVLGVRMGLLAGALLDLPVPQTTKRLYTIMETDGCAADGVAVASNCWVGRRTMRIEDLGKVAATFVDTVSNRAVRIVPRLEARLQARALAPEARNVWEAQLLGYQRLPDDQLLSAQFVALRVPVEVLISRPGRRVQCDGCGEEVLNEREVVRDDRVLCRSCADGAYYLPVAETAALSV